MAMDSDSCMELEVRWSASGNIAHSILMMSAMRIAEIKAVIREKVGIPVEEQRLLDKHGQELSGDWFVKAGEACSPLMLVRCVTDPCITNLGHFRACTNNFPMFPLGQFTVVNKLAEGIHGDVFRCSWQRQESAGAESVAVKKLRNEGILTCLEKETDERTIHLRTWEQAPEAEDALTEIGILQYLMEQPDLSPHLLRMLAVYADDGYTWLVTELAEGGELFAVAASESITEVRVQSYMWQLLHAVDYLHDHNIGHRDISLENMLLKDGSVKLMDFGMAVRSCTVSGAPLRYFRGVGKDNYRAPEAYVPASATVNARVPFNLPPDGVATVQTSSDHLCEVRFSPHAVPGSTCMAEVWGYGAKPSDIFASGVCFFILSWSLPPWVRAELVDPMFSYVYRRGESGLPDLLRHWGKPLLSEKGMQLLSQMMCPNPCQRPSAKECLMHPWLAQTATDVDVAMG
mmetsp:Transcript_112795/g.224369  ORF Transcript_112795/g.224369 Transcript_112795/m.224369 type:complete len:459 (+) Transcript_112795:124-1500(+)